MGLAERRAAKEFEDKFYPELKKQVLAAAKADVPIDVKWDTLATADQSHLYGECWPKVYFDPLIQALKSITRDQMGADALKQALKKIVIQNVGGYYSGGSWSKFDAGTLTLDHESCTNVDNVDERRDALVKMLESKL